MAASKTNGLSPDAPKGKRSTARSAGFVPIGIIVQANDKEAARVSQVLHADPFICVGRNYVAVSTGGEVRHV